jgi:hypothetical protein
MSSDSTIAQPTKLPTRSLVVMYRDSFLGGFGAGADMNY